MLKEQLKVAFMQHLLRIICAQTSQAKILSLRTELLTLIDSLSARNRLIVSLAKLDVQLASDADNLDVLNLIKTLNDADDHAAHTEVMAVRARIVKSYEATKAEGGWTDEK